MPLLTRLLLSALVCSSAFALPHVTSGGKTFTDGSTPHPLLQFGYAYDGIGNRTSSLKGTRSSTYAPNSVNEYTGRTVPPYLSVTGQKAQNAFNQMGNDGGGTASKGGGDLMRAVAAMDGTPNDKAAAIIAGAKELNLTFTPVSNVSGGWFVFLGKAQEGGVAPLLAINPTTGELFTAINGAGSLILGGSGTNYLTTQYLKLIK